MRNVGSMGKAVRKNAIGNRSFVICLVQMWQHTARSEGGVFGPLTSEGH